MLRHRLMILLVLLGMLFIASGTASAAYEYEYITYNGFDAVTSAFQRIGLIFADANFNGLFISVICLGFLLGVYSFLFNSALSGRAGGLAGLGGQMLTGLIIYFALIVPKGSIIVYDQVRNQQSPTLTNIPIGIVAMAGIFNLIEQGIVTIVDQSADIVSYQVAAGGIGFNLLNGVSNNGILLDDPNINTSLQKYAEDCVFFEMNQQNAQITLDQLSSNTNFLTLFQKAANPGVYTTFYSVASTNGMAESCADAWTSIQTAISDQGNYTKSHPIACANAGYDPGVVVSQPGTNACDMSIANTTQWVTGTAYTWLQFYQQTMAAQAINNALMSGNPNLAVQTIANRGIGNQMVSTALVANDWIPIMRAAAIAIALSLTPFLALLIPTPMVGRAVKLILGLFIWLTLWAIVDAIVHSFAVTYAQNVFQDAQNYQLGLTSMNNFALASEKTLAMFGGLRFAAFSLATTITVALGFYGNTLAQAAGTMMSPLQTGASSAAPVATPEGWAHQMNAVESAPSVWDSAHRFGYGVRSGSNVASRGATFQAGMETAGAFGGSYVESGHWGGHNTAMTNVDNAWRGMQVDQHAAGVKGTADGRAYKGQANAAETQVGLDNYTAIGAAREIQGAGSNMAFANKYNMWNAIREKNGEQSGSPLEFAIATNSSGSYVGSHGENVSINAGKGGTGQMQVDWQGVDKNGIAYTGQQKTSIDEKGAFHSQAHLSGSGWDYTEVDGKVTSGSNKQMDTQLRKSEAAQLTEKYTDTVADRLGYLKSGGLAISFGGDKKSSTGDSEKLSNETIEMLRKTIKHDDSYQDNKQLVNQETGYLDTKGNFHMGSSEGDTSKEGTRNTTTTNKAGKKTAPKESVGQFIEDGVTKGKNMSLSADESGGLMVRRQEANGKVSTMKLDAAQSRDFMGRYNHAVQHVAQDVVTKDENYHYLQNLMGSNEASHMKQSMNDASLTSKTEGVTTSQALPAFLNTFSNNDDRITAMNYYATRPEELKQLNEQLRNGMTQGSPEFKAITEKIHSGRQAVSHNLNNLAGQVAPEQGNAQGNAAGVKSEVVRDTEHAGKYSPDGTMYTPNAADFNNSFASVVTNIDLNRGKLDMFNFSPASVPDVMTKSAVMKAWLDAPAGQKGTLDLEVGSGNSKANGGSLFTDKKQSPSGSGSLSTSK